jgi:2-polyprenyl-3-methyl-5-hydroxy-6-metoxy-1,4-benzoquinol methylase
MSQAGPNPERIFQLITGGWAAGIVGAASTHAVFAHLEDGAANAQLLAEKAGISPRGAQVLLDGLLGLGLVELAGGSYRNAAEAEAFLIEGRPGYIGGFARVMAANLAEWTDVAEVARTGVPVKNDTTDLADNPFWAELVPAIAPLSVPSALAAAEALGLAGAAELSILDVGGGSGIFSAILLGLNRVARATQLDWAPVNAIAHRIVASHGVGDRFTTIDGDFHTVEFGEHRYDVAIYSHIAHQESPADNIAIFTKLRHAIRPGGALVVNDFVVDDDRSGPPFALLFAAEMMINNKYGSTWCRKDYKAWLIEAGFGQISFHATPGPATLVIAR